MLIPQELKALEVFFYGLGLVGDKYAVFGIVLGGARGPVIAAGYQFLFVKDGKFVVFDFIFVMSLDVYALLF